MLHSSGAAFPRGNVATLLILLCVRWYVAYSLSLRNLEEMMAERGIEVDNVSQ
jgi:transposase-like protein